MSIDQKVLEDALIKKGVVNEKTLESLKKHAQTQSISLENLLFEREIIPDEKLGEIMAELYGVPFVKVSE